MSIKNTERVSVLIPTFNAAAYLAESLESVLLQDWPSIEIIVCDDGSTDDSVVVAQRAGRGIRVELAAHRRGLAATRNRAIGLASGEMLLHLDADDILQPGAITTLARHLSPGCDVVVGRLTSFISPELSREVAARFTLPAEPQGGHLPGTTLVRKSVFETYGLLDESYTIGADLAWFVKAQNSGAVIRRIDDIVLRRRIHGNNQSLVSRKEWPASALRTVRDAIWRRRAQD
jgi:glycosyltransferase involved in cell wall biosynthesis